MAQSEMDYMNVGEDKVCATAFQLLAANEPSITFSNLLGTPKKCIFIGRRWSSSLFSTGYANFNPATGEVDGKNYTLYYSSGSTANNHWNDNTTVNITINGNSATMTTGNADALLWILIYTY